MPARNSCPRCGAELRPQDSEGFCTRCLLAKGLDEPVVPPELSGPVPTHAPPLEAEDLAAPVQSGSVRRFGDYELLDEIARGGMGVIYRARQLSLGRIVAVKMILAGQFASQQIIQRFRGEVTAAALLQHSNIVAIHDVGVHDGQHYFSMDYVEGQNLSQLVGNRPLPGARAARYVKLIAHAIHYAHQQGILHRDLKPSNVLVDASDQPRITDFGLAKRLGSDSSMTVTGQMLGSPNFMPPEQASSQRGKVGRHSDVYGLGAILYYLLTARPPFQAESFEGVITQVLNVEALSPRLLNSSVPSDLDTICVKCLQKEPKRRYQSAQELADELGHFLRHEPILARPITRAERAWRWCRRNPVVAGLGVALVLAIFIGFAGITWQLSRLSREESITRRNLYTADMNRVQQLWDQGNLQEAQRLLWAHLPEPGKEDLRGFEWRYLTNLCQDESLHTFTNINFAVGSLVARHGLALAADGRRVIAASGTTLKLLDCQQQPEVQTLTIGSNSVSQLSMAMNQPGLVAYRTDRVNALSPTGEVLLGGGLASHLGGCPNPSQNEGAFALSWDGTLLAASTTNSTVGIFDVKTGQQLGPFFRLGGKENVVGLAFSPDAKYLACGTSETRIHILKAPELKEVRQFKAHTAYVHSLAFDPAGKKLVSGSGDGHLRVWNFPDCGPLADFSGNLGGIDDLAFSPDGLRLASVGTDHTVQLWNFTNPGARSTVLHGHRDEVKSVLFSRDGTQLYTGSNEGSVKVWDVSPRESTNNLAVSDWSDEVAFSPDGRLVAVADFTSRNAVLYRLSNRSRIGTMGKHPDACRRVKFSPDGKLLATIGGTVQVGDIATGKTLYELNLPASNGSLSFHPSKPILAVACGEGPRFLDLRNGQPINLLPAAPTDNVEVVLFSPKGEWIALGMYDGQVSIWDSISGRLLYAFREHTAPIHVLCFSHDGRVLASGGWDNRVVLHHVRKRRNSALEGHWSAVLGLAFAPDDKTLVSTSWDGTIRFWSMANHQVALTLTHDRGPANGVAFSPNGNLMATTGTAGKAILWPAATMDETVPSLKWKTKTR